jgi:hypothetical protein
MFVAYIMLLIISPIVISILLGWNGLGLVFLFVANLLSECEVLWCRYIDCFV